MFLLLVQLSLAAEVTIFTETPAVVSVDGQILDYDEGSLLLRAQNLKAGKHLVKVQTPSGKAITSLEVTVLQTQRLDLVYGERTLSEVGKGLVGDGAVTSYFVGILPYDARCRMVGGILSTHSPDGSTTTREWDACGRVTLSTSGPPPSSAATAPVGPVPQQVIFSLKDSFDLSKVYVDGSRTVEFHTGDKEKTVSLMTGTHTVEIKEFTEFETWFKGTLLVTPGEPIRFGFGEDEGVEIYNRGPEAWVPKP